MNKPKRPTAEELRDLKEFTGASLRELGETFGVSPTTISNWMKPLCPEKRKTQNAASYARNREKTRKHRRAVYAANPEPSIERSKAWLKANPEKVASYKKGSKIRERVRRLAAEIAAGLHD